MSATKITLYQDGLALFVWWDLIHISLDIAIACNYTTWGPISHTNAAKV